MIYENIIKANFITRDNRFIAHILVDGKEEICHVKNTGRCKELLVPNAEILVQKNNDPKRKTKFSLITVNKNGRLINMDSQAPNAVTEEWLKNGGLFVDITNIKREQKFENSRFDFYFERGGKKCFMEVKGVTLENDNIVSFPDAPSERAVKHLKELQTAHNMGYDCYVLFVVQMENVKFFEPNAQNHKAFAQELKKARDCGINVLAYDCNVKPDSLIINKAVGVSI